MITKPKPSIFERIKTQIHGRKPFVLYSEFNQNVIKALLQTDSNCYQTSRFNESGFVFAPFDLKNQPTYIIPKSFSESLEFNLESKSASFLSSQNSKSNAEVHINLIKKAIKSIKETELEKVVLARIGEIEFLNINILDMFCTVAKAYPEAYTYFWFHPKTGVWMGASPETLLNIEGHKLQSAAIAGTQIFKDSTEIKWDVKNFEEQTIVTNYLKKTLSKYLKCVNISKSKTIRAGKLLHLKTLLSGTLKSIPNGFKDLLHDVHPTPAVCGTPKKAAMAFIRDYEPIDRSYYSGFLGEIRYHSNPEFQYADLVVNLRCMQLYEKTARLYAGGGITNKSIPENEWEETEAKIQTLKFVF
ncbi:MAG: isochorismate synthase [Formosa sp.]|nr:isochorismate synthase [Formosa sp.]